MPNEIDEILSKSSPEAQEKAKQAIEQFQQNVNLPDNQQKQAGNPLTPSTTQPEKGAEKQPGLVERTEERTVDGKDLATTYDQKPLTAQPNDTPKKANTVDDVLAQTEAKKEAGKVVDTMSKEQQQEAIGQGEQDKDKTR